ncbi:MAG: proteasome accessory factor PafA2 family protein [Acidobacteriota bacterium]
MVPKLCGGDTELGNAVLGMENQDDSCFLASRMLLDEVDGVAGRKQAARARPDGMERSGWWSLLPVRRAGNDRPGIDGAGVPAAGPGDGDRAGRTGAADCNPQDWGRKYLPANGGCIYVDLDHLELCLPEVLSAHDHVAAWHALLRLARKALARANARLPRGQKIQVLVNNSDGCGHSYGGHLNFLISRPAWERLFHRKLHQMLFLASYQASSIIFTGQGKVGSENGTPAVPYQLSQRADFFETLTGTQTTWNRPLVNSRNEPLCGPVGGARPGQDSISDSLARLHVIFYDSNLSETASLLKVGVMQIILAMIEAEWVDHALVLDDPVTAVIQWSHDPSLQAAARTMPGRRLTALELQFLFLKEAGRFVRRAMNTTLVPGCRAILKLWEETLVQIEAGDPLVLARRLDWALKRLVLQRALDRRPDLRWESPSIKHLDHLYGSLEEGEGIFWAYQRAGFVESQVSPARIRAYMTDPPPDTRAWTRAHLLRLAGADRVEEVNWDFIRFRCARNGSAGRSRTLYLDNPLGSTRAENRDILAESRSLDDVLDALGACETPRPTSDTNVFHAWGDSNGYRIS